MKKEDFKAAADTANLAGLVWASVVLVPTWFEPFREYNGIANSVLALLAITQAYLLRKWASS
jgi:hypothetical protein